MICTECAADDGIGADLRGLSIEQIINVCRHWKCIECSKTDEEIQAEFDAAAKASRHEPAHDWAAIERKKNGR